MSTSKTEVFVIQETQQPYKLELRWQHMYPKSTLIQLNGIDNLYAVESIETYRYSMVIYFAAHLKTPAEMARDIVDWLKNYIEYGSERSGPDFWLYGATVASCAKRR